MSFREPINYNADSKNYEALKLWPDNFLKDNDTHRDSNSFPIQSTVAMQRDDDGPWKHGMIAKSNSAAHSHQLYKVRAMKIDRLITCNKRHIL